MATEIDRSGCQARRRHGTYSAYQNDFCRCPDAREAHRLYGKRRRVGRPEVRMMPALGFARRYTNLRALGYTRAYLAAELGMNVSTLSRAVHHSTQVLAAHHHRMAELYTRISNEPGPSDLGATRAVAAGLLPPPWWDDDDLDNPKAKPQMPARDRSATYDESRVIRACRGEVHYDQMWPAERAEAVRRLNRALKTDGEIAEILHAEHDAIGHRRRRMGLPSRYDPASYLGRAS